VPTDLQEGPRELSAKYGLSPVDYNQEHGVSVTSSSGSWEAVPFLRSSPLHLLLSRSDYGAVDRLRDLLCTQVDSSAIPDPAAKTRSTTPTHNGFDDYFPVELSQKVRKLSKVLRESIPKPLKERSGALISMGKAVHLIPFS
jgi:hypothetical protein